MKRRANFLAEQTTFEYYFSFFLVWPAFKRDLSVRFIQQSPFLGNEKAEVPRETSLYHRGRGNERELTVYLDELLEFRTLRIRETQSQTNKNTSNSDCSSFATDSPFLSIATVIFLLPKANWLMVSTAVALHVFFLSLPPVSVC
jgi:hypothetical protein